MKRIALTLLCAVVLGAAPFASVFAQQTKKGAAAAPAAPSAALKIAVIDVEQIRRESLGLKDAREQLARYHAAIQADIQKEEAGLREANQELARQRSILSPEAFAEERKKFEQRLGQVQRMVQQRRQQFDDAQVGVLKKMDEAMFDVIGQLAIENGYTLILRTDQLMLAADPLLITKTVVERLNKRLPSLKVPDPTQPPPKQQ